MGLSLAICVKSLLKQEYQQKICICSNSSFLYRKVKPFYNQALYRRVQTAYGLVGEVTALHVKGS